MDVIEYYILNQEEGRLSRVRSVKGDATWYLETKEAGRRERRTVPELKPCT